jgi:NodT family efflux transporter outer membrane factor (OMF) lipoprotein
MIVNIFKKSAAHAAISAAILALSACVVGPEYKKPEAIKADSFTRDASFEGKGSTSIKVDWWRSYNSPELNKLIELALKHNSSIQAATANLKVAQQNTIAQQGFYFPSVSIGTSRTVQNNGAALSTPTIVNPGPGNAAPTYSVNSAGLSVGFVPDIFGANKRAVESLKGIENNAKYQLAALQITVVTNVIQAVSQETTLREELRLAEAAERAAFKQLEHFRRMAAIGYNSGVDLALQETSYAAVAAQVPTIRKLHEQTIDMLNVMCGELPSSKLGIPNIEALSIPSDLPVAVPSGWIDKRPDVKAAEEMVKSSNAQIGVAIANMIPQISISGFTGATAGAFSSLKDTLNRSWSSTISVNQNLFAGGSLLARKRAAEANLEYSLDQYKLAVLTAFQNVADTLYAIDQDKRSFEIARSSAEANKRIYEYTQIQFDKGYASEPMLLSTEQLYLASEINRMQAYALYLGDTAALYQSLGGGWPGPTPQATKTSTSASSSPPSTPTPASVSIK